jgi:hypothetical protein
VRTRFEAWRVSPIAEPAGHMGNAEFTDYWALKNSNTTEARSVRPNSDANPPQRGLTLSERRFQEYDEFLFRDRQAIEEWAVVEIGAATSCAALRVKRKPAPASSSGVMAPCRWRSDGQCSIGRLEWGSRRSCLPRLTEQLSGSQPCAALRASPAKSSTGIALQQRVHRNCRIRDTVLAWTGLPDSVFCMA